MQLVKIPSLTFWLSSKAPGIHSWLLAQIVSIFTIHALKTVEMRRLTNPVGEQMAELPLDPRLGRALLASAELGCSQEIAAICAILSVQSIWFAGNGQAALSEAKAKYEPNHCNLDKSQIFFMCNAFVWDLRVF